MAAALIAANLVEQIEKVVPGDVRAARPLGAVLLDEETFTGEYEELCWQYLHRLPAGFKLGRLKTRIENEPGAFGARRYEFDSRLFVDNGSDDPQQEPVGQLMVTLYRKPGGADDEIFLELEQCQIWYPELRGQGLGRAMFRLVEKLGRALNVKALTAVAIYDGRFIWPALGFRFGDYLPEEEAARKFRERFVNFCRLHDLTPPDVTTWDAPDFARFAGDIQLKAAVGHRMDRRPQLVEVGRSFLLTRRPFFLTYPL